MHLLSVLVAGPARAAPAPPPPPRAAARASPGPHSVPPPRRPRRRAPRPPPPPACRGRARGRRVVHGGAGGRLRCCRFRHVHRGGEGRRHGGGLLAMAAHLHLLTAAPDEVARRTMRAQRAAGVEVRCLLLQDAAYLAPPPLPPDRHVHLH